MSLPCDVMMGGGGVSLPCDVMMGGGGYPYHVK